MAQQTEVQLFTLAGLAHRCAQETEHFFQRQEHDPAYCFELFRRAILGRDEQAWNLIYAQYRPLVAGWVERHSAFPSAGEEVQYFVNRAFEKMWSALTPEKYVKFPDIRSVLRYLQMCVHSTLVDQVRRAELDTVDLKEEITGGEAGEPQALEGVQRQELWQEISRRLQDEKERTVVYGSFLLGLKPREICVRFPHLFPKVSQVYRTKENVLARLRRDAELAKFVDPDA